MAKRTKASTPEVADFGITHEPPNDLDFSREVGQVVAGFLKQAKAFFETADRYEVSALKALDAAKALRPFTTEQEDVDAQGFIKTLSAAKRKVNDHWAITSTVHKLHRRLTARRDRATKTLDEAIGIANRHHNAYVEAERRRAQAEEDRLRREAEAKAEKDRQVELDRLEAERLEAEEASDELSDRERIFVDAVAEFGQEAGVNAARRAGYKNPVTQAARLASDSKIITAIDAAKRAKAAQEQQQALKSAPLDVQDVEVKPNISKASGATDRTTYKAEVTDAELFISAVFENKLGIPRDVLKVDEVRLHQYARELRQVIDRWPGVRLVKTTRVV